MMESTQGSSFFTLTSAISLAAVAVAGLLAYVGSRALLPKNAKSIDRCAFIWLAFDAIIHFAFEGSFLWLSLFGRQVNTSGGFFADMWKEYAKADFRWGIADPTVVSLEILTVLGVAPMCLYVLRQLINNDPARHYWIIVLSTAELYGGFMTFAPEWLTASPNLDTSNFLYLWIYLVLMNVLWVGFPLYLMIDSYEEIARAMRAQALPKPKQA